jgi:hypothetical protein
MSKKSKDNINVELEIADAVVEETAAVTVEEAPAATRAVVLEDFAFSICLSPGMPSYTQLFRRKTLLNDIGIIKLMLAAGKPIEILE